MSSAGQETGEAGVAVAIDEGVVAGHDAVRLGHLVATHGDQQISHHAGDPLVVDGLDATEGDDEPLTDDGAAPLDVTRVLVDGLLVEVGGVLLDVAAGAARAPGQLGLGERDVAVDVGLGIHAADDLHEEVVVLGVKRRRVLQGRVEHHEDTSVLVADVEMGCLLHGGKDDVPGTLAHLLSKQSTHD